MTYNNRGNSASSRGGYGRGAPPRQQPYDHFAHQYSPPPPPGPGPYYPGHHGHHMTPHHSPPPPMHHGGQHAWNWTPSPYAPPQPGSPTYGFGPPVHAVYPRGNSYAPAHSPEFYQQPQPMRYNTMPPHQQMAYPPAISPQQYQPQRGGHHSPPNDRRQSGTSERRSARGHYSNLSWTPTTGSRGGHQIPPKTRNADKNKNAAATSEEEDPFRPPKDLRADDDDKQTPHAPDAAAVGDKGSIQPKEGRASAKHGQTSAEHEQTSAEQKQTPAEHDQTSVGKEQAPNDNAKIKFNIKPKAPLAAPVTPTSTAELSAKKREPQTSARVKALREASVPRTPDNRHHDPASQDDPAFEDATASEDRNAFLLPSTENQVVMVERIKPKPRLTVVFRGSKYVYYREEGGKAVIGCGTYGTVFKGINVYTNKEVALKMIKTENEKDGSPVTALREMKLLQALRHENVVQLLEIMVEKSKTFMVFDYSAHDLTGLLQHPTFKLQDSHKKHLAKQVFQGLEYLHFKGVLHRDIKAANILVSSTGQLKLADFGLARFYEKNSAKPIDYTNRVITVWYRPPELLLGSTQYGPPVDIWSAACVLVEILTRDPIFKSTRNSDVEQLRKVYGVLGTATREEWPDIVTLPWYELVMPVVQQPKTGYFEAKYRKRLTPAAYDLIKAMFSYDPQRRPTAGEILANPYFTTEEPAPAQAYELKDIVGDWHEHESKVYRKLEKKTEAEKRKAAGNAEGSKDAKKTKLGEGSINAKETTYADGPTGLAEAKARLEKLESVKASKDVLASKDIDATKDAGATKDAHATEDANSASNVDATKAVAESSSSTNNAESVSVASKYVEIPKVVAEGSTEANEAEVGVETTKDTKPTMVGADSNEADKAEIGVNASGSAEKIDAEPIQGRNVIDLHAIAATKKTDTDLAQDTKITDAVQDVETTLTDSAQNDNAVGIDAVQNAEKTDTDSAQDAKTSHAVQDAMKVDADAPKDVKKTTLTDSAHNDIAVGTQVPKHVKKTLANPIQDVDVVDTSEVDADASEDAETLVANAFKTVKTADAGSSKVKPGKAEKRKAEGDTEVPKAAKKAKPSSAKATKKTRGGK